MIQHNSNVEFVLLHSLYCSNSTLFTDIKHTETTVGTTHCSTGSSSLSDSVLSLLLRYVKSCFVSICFLLPVSAFYSLYYLSPRSLFPAAPQLPESFCFIFVCFFHCCVMLSVLHRLLFCNSVVSSFFSSVFFFFQSFLTCIFSFYHLTAGRTWL